MSLDHCLRHAGPIQLTAVFPEEGVQMGESFSLGPFRDFEVVRARRLLVNPCRCVVSAARANDDADKWAEPHSALLKGAKCPAFLPHNQDQ